MIAALLLYLPLLALTIAIELAVVAPLAPRPRRDALRACVALNVCTHPFASLLLVATGGASFGASELAVALLEGLGYTRLAGVSPRRAFVIALAANVLSLLGGVLLALVVERL